MAPELVNGVLVNTLVLASMYILAALGFAFLFNMLGVINLAHGAVYMIGAYVSYYILAGTGLSNWISMIISTLIMAGFGLLMERICFTPFQASFNKVIMVCVAVMTILQTTTVIMSGVALLKIPSFAISGGTTVLLGITISNEKLVTLAVGVFLLLVVLYIVNFTTLGRQMQAVAQNRTGAALQGIKIRRISAIVCALGFGLAAVAGSMMGAYQNLSTNMGDNMTLKILMLVMLAGAGSMNGVIITGILVAFLDSFFPTIVQGYSAAAWSSGIIVVLLLIKPKGFFGHEM